MTVITSFDVEIFPEDVLAAQKSRKAVSPTIQKATEEAIELAYQLIEPSALYSWFEVVSIEEQHVIIKSETSHQEKRLFIGPYVSELKKAQQVIIEVHTLGPVLEEKVQELSGSGEMLPGYLLDCAGVVALGKVNQGIHRMVEQVAAEKGWGVGASLSPGSLQGWPLNNQFHLCSMLDLSQIGVRVTDSHLLIPVKSVSSMIGIGSDYTKKKVSSMCHLCNLRDTCWRRKK